MLTNMENVFGPKHHGGSDDPFETIKVLEHWLTPDEMIGFCKGQSIVYQRRHRVKGGLEDLAKSAWYQNYLIKYLAARGLSAFGETSAQPQKSDPPSDPSSPPSPSSIASPPPSSAATPGLPPAATLQAPSGGLGAGAAADDTSNLGGVDLDAEIKEMAAKLAPPRPDQAA